MTYPKKPSAEAVKNLMEGIECLVYMIQHYDDDTCDALAEVLHAMYEIDHYALREALWALITYTTPYPVD